MQQKANVQSRKLQHQGKTPGGSLWTGQFPSFKTMRNVKFKLYITTFSGDGGEQVKVKVTAGKCMRMANYPVDPSGNLPLESTP